MSVRQDVINLSVNINGNDAQNKLNDLRKRSADLRFEMQGLAKDSADYAAKAKELSGVTDEMNKLKQQIGLTALTQKELTQELTRLKALKGSMTPFTDEFKAMDSQIKQVEARLVEVKTGIEGVGPAMEAAGESGSKFGRIFESVGEHLVAFFAIETVFDKVKEFFSKSIEEANQAEEAVDGLRVALENAGRLDVFDRLIKKADDFAARYKALDNDDVTRVFTKLIDYGKLTEKQINETTEVIINYARKQKVSLDEATDTITKAFEGSGKALKIYGINLTDAKTFTERFNVVTQQLGEKVKGAEAAFEETKQGGMARFKQALRDMEESFGRFLYSLTSFPDKAEQVKKEFEETSKSVQNLNTNILPLTFRVDELENKAKKLGGTTHLSKIEQDELKSAIQNIGSIIPGAVTQFDAYGNAIGISTDKAREFIKIQQNVLKVKNAAEIDSTKSTISELQKQIDYNNKWADNIIANYKRAFNQAKAAGRNVVDSPDNPIYNQAADIKKDNEPLKEKLDQQQDYLKSINGDFLKEQTDDAEKRAKEIAELQKQLAGLTKGTKDYADVVAKLKKLNVFTDNAAIGFGDTDKTNKEDNALENKQKELLQKINDFTAELQRVGKSQDDSEIMRIKKKYDDLIAAAQGYNGFLSKNSAQVVALQKAELDAISVLLEEEKKKRAEASQKNFKEGTAKEYDEQVGNTNVYYELQKAQESARYVQGLEDRKTFEANLLTIDAQSKAEQLQNARNYAANVEKAAADVTKFEAEELQKQVQATIAVNEQKLANAKALEQLQKEANKALPQADVKTAQPGSVKAAKAERVLLQQQYKEELDDLKEKEQKQIQSVEETNRAELKLLIAQAEAKRKMELAAIDPNDPNAAAKKAEINKRYNDAENEAKIASASETAGMLEEIQVAYKKKIQGINQQFDKDDAQKEREAWAAKQQKRLDDAQMAVDVAGSLDKALSAIENSALNRELRANAIKRQHYQIQLDHKLMSQAQFNFKTAQLDREDDIKKDELAKKQFKRNKALQIAQTLINSASAGIKLWVDPGFPAAIPLEVALGVETLAAVATIAATQYDAAVIPPAPAMYGEGGLLDKGPYHRDPEKGLPVVDPRTGETQMLLEKDEAVINGNAMRSKENVTVSGTPTQIASALNSRYGGVSWASGANITAPKWVTSRPSQINPNMSRIMATGGMITPVTQTTVSTTEGNSELPDLIRKLIDIQTAQTEEIKTMKTKLHAVVSIKEYRIEEAKYDAAQKASSLG